MQVLDTSAALNALGLIDLIRRSDLTADGGNGALSGAGRTALTLICINNKAGKLFTYACGAAFFVNMSLIFVAEVTEG